MATRAAANSFFFLFYFGGKKITKNFLGKKNNRKLKKKRSQSAQIFSPGRWAGNKLFFNGGLSSWSAYLRVTIRSLLLENMYFLCLFPMHFN